MSFINQLTNSLADLEQSARRIKTKLEKSAVEVKSELTALTRKRSPEEIAAQVLQTKENVEACNQALQDATIQEMKTRRQIIKETEETKTHIETELQKIKLLQLESNTRPVLQEQLWKAFNDRLENLAGGLIAIQNAECVARGLLLEEIDSEIDRLFKPVMKIFNLPREEQEERNKIANEESEETLLTENHREKLLLTFLQKYAIELQYIKNNSSVNPPNITFDTHLKKHYMKLGFEGNFTNICISDLIDFCIFFKQQAAFIANNNYTDFHTESHLKELIDSFLRKIKTDLEKYQGARKGKGVFERAAWNIKDKIDTLQTPRESIKTLIDKIEVHFMRSSDFEML
ncbi:MAG: hypothetical protein RLZZ453_1264 [Chlamydiota bacterium]|jgi:predicted kinase